MRLLQQSGCIFGPVLTFNLVDQKVFSEGETCSAEEMDKLRDHCLGWTQPPVHFLIDFPLEEYDGRTHYITKGRENSDSCLHPLSGRGKIGAPKLDSD